MRPAFLILLFVCISVSGQNKSDYLDRFIKVNQFAKENNLNIGALSVPETQKVFRMGGGIDATLMQTDFIKKNVNKLEGLIANGMTMPGQLVMYLPLSPAEAANLANVISSGKDAKLYLAALLAFKGKVRLVELKEFFRRLQAINQRPARPDSPSNRSIRRVIKRGMKIQKLKLPEASGDYLSNLSAGVDYNYTEYEDTNINEEGNIHDWSFSLNGTIFENTDLSFSFLMNEIEARGDLSDTDGDTRGGDMLLLHKLNDNFGLGTYAFYQETNYRDGDDHAIGKGFGFLFSTVHDLGADFELSTVHTITRAYYEFGHDTLWISSLNLTRYWGDSLSTTLSVSFTDSVRSETEGDNTYWTFGGSIGYNITDNLHFYVGYQTDRKIDDYKSRTWNFGFNYRF